MIFVGIGA
jgi:hypothetical protein